MTKKRTIIILIGCIIALTFYLTDIAAIDAPHNEGNSVYCQDCHVGPQFPLVLYWFPDFIPQTIDDTPFNMLCLSLCHFGSSAPYEEGKGPWVKTHSSVTTSDEDSDCYKYGINCKYGVWKTECINCHKPHKQLQKNYQGTDAGNLYLAQGTITSYVYNPPVPPNPPEPPVPETTTLNYSTITYKAGWEWNPPANNKLIAKTGNDRRTVLFPDASNLNYSYSITAVDPVAQTITVKGDATTNLSPPTTFAVMYGQFIKDSILVDEDTGTYSTVKFFDQTGTNSFADGDETYDGVCEVCHTQTKHFRNDAYGSDPAYTDPVHTNVQTGGAAGANCITCHSHKDGFVHGGDGGTGCGTSTSCHGTQSHPTHLNNASGRDISIGCSECHDKSNFPAFKDGRNLEETTACNTCHSPGGTYDGVNDPVFGAKANWDNGAYSANNLKSGKEKWCISCHDSGTSEINGVSAPNVELYYTSGHGKADADVECLVCHDATFTHFDGKPRTYAFSNEDVNPADGHADMYDMANSGVAYAAGYRLRYVNGKVPIMIPTDYTYTFGAQEGLIKNNTNRRCFNTGCHDSSKIFGYDSVGNAYTNFSVGPPDPPQSYGGSSGGWGNLHEVHLRYITWNSDWDVNTGMVYYGFDSMITCSSCHNVHGTAGTHGSTNEPMIRDGSLEGGAGYGFSYLIEDPVLHYPYVTSQGATRANSVGAIFRNGVDNMCGFCHNGGSYIPPENSYYAAPTKILYNGVHTGSTSDNTLKVNGTPWTEGELVGKYVRNITDGSEDIIIGNTTNTVTGDRLIGGTTNLWQPGNQAEVFEYNNPLYMDYFRSPHDLSSTVDMIWTYDSHGGKNYSSLSTWEQDTDIDITAANDVIVLSHSGLTGSIASGDTVTGANSGATGVVIGVVTATQICIDVSGGTFQKGEQIYKTLNVNYVVSTSHPAHVGVMYLDCYDGPHADRVTMAGATTDGGHYRCIRSASDCNTPFAGKRGTGAYFEWNAINVLFRLDEDFARVENIGGKLTYSDTTTKTVFWLHGNYTKAIGCVAYDSTNSGTGSLHGFVLQGANTVAANCIAHNIKGDGFFLYGNYPFSNYAINCTAINNGGKGFRQTTGGENISFWNCVASHNAGGDFYIIAPTLYCCMYNMSSDGTAPGDTSKINKDFTNMWVDETLGSQDYHLSETGALDSDFQGGTDPETFYPYGQYKVADDIDGELRTIWYRGADEFGPPGNDYEFIYISGRAGTLDGVTMSGLQGNPVTSGGGFYSAVVGHGWSGTVTPEKQGYTFNPANRSYSNVTTEQANQDYTPAINTYTISGHVGTLDGVTMSGLHGNPVTSGGGFYSGTIYYGEYMYVIPLKDGYRFDPSGRQYYDYEVTSDQENQDYTPIVTHKVSGHVGTLDGVFINGISYADVITSGGFYSGIVDDGWSGTAFPRKDGYMFAPANRSYSNVTTDQTNQDYTPTAASYTISGRVGTMDGVTMSGLPGNPVTSGGGFYSAIVGYGWDKQVIPIKVGYNFTPSNRYYYDVASNYTNQDYTPSVKTFTISGHVGPVAGGNLAGVTMSGLPGNPVTNSSGLYTATVTWGWSGTVIPTRAGYTFTPTNRVYSYVTYNQANQNYTTP